MDTAAAAALAESDWIHGKAASVCATKRQDRRAEHQRPKCTALSIQSTLSIHLWLSLSLLFLSVSAAVFLPPFLQQPQPKLVIALVVAAAAAAVPQC